MTTTESIKDGVHIALGNGLIIGEVPIGELLLLERNARVMDNKMFRNLVDNIARDGRLESVPLCHKEPGGYRVLSGNHRVQAALEAGVEKVLILYFEGDLSDADQIAKQLSHNAISGQDDMTALRELYEEIDDISLRYYAGLDDKALGQMEDVQLLGLSDDRLDFQLISFAFLPDEVERVKEVILAVRKVMEGDAIMVRWSDYDRFLDTLEEVKARHKVLNGATAVTIMLDIVEEWLVQKGTSETDAQSGDTDG